MCDGGLWGGVACVMEDWGVWGVCNRGLGRCGVMEGVA